MKKVFNFNVLVAIILLFGTVACGNSNSSNNSANDSSSANSDENSNITSVSCGNDSGAAKYFKMFSGGTYHMKAKMVGGGVESTMEMYIKDGNMANFTEMGKMILKDNKMYIISDEAKTVMVSNTTPSASIGGGIETDGMTLTGSGKDEFDGKNLPYEEYSDGEGNKARYFLDGDKLAGIRNINDEMTIDVIVLVLDQNVPDSAFDVPSGYKKIEY